MVWTMLKTAKAHAQAHAGDPQAEALKAARDMAAILSDERHKKKNVAHPNEMAALALVFHPHLALSASAGLAKGQVASTEQLVSKSIPGVHAKTW